MARGCWERGRFVWLWAKGVVVVLTRAQLSMLLEGIDWRAPRRTWRTERPKLQRLRHQPMRHRRRPLPTLSHPRLMPNVHQPTSAQIQSVIHLT